MTSGGDHTEGLRITPDDDELADRVDAVVRARPDLFEEAGRRMDETFSAESVAKKEAPPLPEDQRAAWATEAEESGDPLLAEIARIPEPSDFEHPRTRFRFVWRHMAQFDLGIDVPNLGWEWSAQVLLTYWLMHCSAAGPPRLTCFQEWSWEDDDSGVGRDCFRFPLNKSDQEKLLHAARRALREAEVRVKAQPVARLHSTAEEALRYIRKEGPVLAKQVAFAVNCSDDHVRKDLIPKLRAAGYDIQTTSDGYLLE